MPNHNYCDNQSLISPSAPIAQVIDYEESECQILGQYTEKDLVLMAGELI